MCILLPVEDYYDNRGIVRDLTEEIITLSKQLGEMTERYRALQVFQHGEELARQGRQTATELKRELDAKS